MVTGTGSRLRARLAASTAVCLGVAGLSVALVAAPSTAANSPVTYGCKVGLIDRDYKVTWESDAPENVDPGATLRPKLTAAVVIPKDEAMWLRIGVESVAGKLTGTVKVGGVDREVTLAIASTKLSGDGDLALAASGTLGDVVAGADGETIRIEAGAISRIHLDKTGLWNLDLGDHVTTNCARKSGAALIDTIAVGEGGSSTGNPDPAPVDLAYECPVPVLGKKTFVSTTHVKASGQVAPGSTFDPQIDVTMSVPADLADSMRSIMGTKALGGQIVSHVNVNGQPRQVTITIPNSPVPATGGFSLAGSGSLGPITAGAAGEWIQIVAGKQDVTMNLYKTTDASDQANPQIMSCALAAGNDGLLANILSGSSAPANPDPGPVDLAYSCEVPLLGKQSFATRIHVKAKGQVDPQSTFDPEVAVTLDIPSGMADQLRGLIGAKALGGVIESTILVNSVARTVVIDVPTAALPTTGGFALSGSGQLGPITAGASGEWIQLVSGAQNVKMSYYKTADASDAPTERQLPCTLNAGQDPLLANILAAKAGTVTPPPPPPPVVVPPTTTPPTTTPPTTTPPTTAGPAPTPGTPTPGQRAGVSAKVVAKQARSGAVKMQVRLASLGDASDLVSGKVRFQVRNKAVKGKKGKLSRTASVLAGGVASVKLGAKQVRALVAGRSAKVVLTVSYSGSELNLPVRVTRVVKLRG